MRWNQWIENLRHSLIGRARSQRAANTADLANTANAAARSRRARRRTLLHERLEERSLLYGGHGLEFNITSTASVPSQVKNAFQVAANQWSSILSDDIVVNVTIDFTNSAAGVGQTLPVSVVKSLTDLRGALLADQQSLDDASAVAHLPTGASASLYTTDFHSGAPLFDDNGTDNNSAFLMTRANAKALGLIPGNSSASDGTIRFLSAVVYDYNPSDGIGAGRYDFVGVAMHEIGHLLGFVSGADAVDFKSKPTGPGYNAASDQDDQIVARPLDLFRHSAGSLAACADFDLRADSDVKYFSLDGGATSLAQFSTGVYHGDGRENQHWKDNLNIGLMDPSLALGEYGDVTWRDVQALDVIGWNLAMDYGDAPDASLGTGLDNYRTTLGDDGPRHVLFSWTGLTADPVGAPKVYLGGAVDRDLNGQPAPLADGDDSQGVDDESGVASFPALVGGTTAMLSVASSATPARNARLDYFFDFNRNGEFNDPGESFSVTLVGAVQSVPVVVPAAAAPGPTFARFRISTAGGLGPTGPAADGEVEDYQVNIESPSPTIVGTSGDDLFNVAYSTSNVQVTRVSSSGVSTLLGTYALGTALSIDGSAGKDRVVVALTPTQIGDLTTSDIFAWNGYLAAPTGKTFVASIPGASGLTTANFESAGLAASDDGAVMVITGCMSLITSDTQIQVGGDGDDVLTGTALADLIFGQGGQDAISGLGGNDCLFGGAGNDQLWGGDLDDLLQGGSGDDFLYGLAGIDSLYGDAGNDTLDGGDGKDYLLGGDGVDVLTTGAGSDFVIVSGDVDCMDVVTDFGVNSDRIYWQGYGATYASLTFDTTSFPGSTIVKLPVGKRVRLLNWSGVVAASQFVF